MAEIVPAILTNDPEEYRSLVEAYNPFAKRVQIDVTDGLFVSNRTIPENSVWWPKNWQVDLHMMVSRPSEHLEALTKIHPSMVIFHAEISEALLPTIQALHNAGIKTGLALLKTTYPGRVQALITAVDHVLIFAGELGQQGGQADLLQIEKVPLIRALNPKVEIGWDGGANLDNVRAIAHAGIDIINVGSALSKAPDKAAAYKELVTEADRRGVKLA